MRYKSVYLTLGDDFIASAQFETGTVVPFYRIELNKKIEQLKDNGYSLIAYDETCQYWRKSVDKTRKI